MSYPPAPPPPMRPEDEKTWAILIHLSGFVTAFLGALIGYLVLRDRGPFIRFHTAQALNLQLTYALAVVASLALLWLVVGFFTLILASIGLTVLMIVGAVKAASGQFWPIPVTIRFVR